MKDGWRPLSPGRRLIGEVCHFARKTPNGVMNRAFDFGPVLAARQAHPAPPPWTVIVSKAVALAAVEIPALREAYVRLPWPGLYRSSVSQPTIVVERQVAGEPIPLFARLKAAESASLEDLARAFAIRVQAPLETASEFRHALRIASLPQPLRRMAWWLGLNVGPWRMRFFGNVAVSVTAPFGAEVSFGVSPLSYFLTYGRIAAGETTLVTLSFDHRVTDGTTIARALVRIEELLNTVIADELRAGAR